MKIYEMSSRNKFAVSLQNVVSEPCCLQVQNLRMSLSALDYQLFLELGINILKQSNSTLLVSVGGI